MSRRCCSLLSRVTVLLAVASLTAACPDGSDPGADDPANDEDPVPAPDGTLDEADVDAAYDLVTDAVCARALGDCREALCVNEDGESCFGSEAACQEAQDAFLEARAGGDPVYIDGDRLDECIAATERTPCSNILGDPSCPDALVIGCAGDMDPYGPNYSERLAHVLPSLPESLPIQLCEYRDEYFAVELQAGQHVEARIVEAIDINFKINIFLAAGGDLDDLEHADNFDIVPVEWTAMPAASASRLHVLEMGMWGPSFAEVTLEFRVVE